MNRTHPASRSEVYRFPCGTGEMPVRRWRNEGAEKVMLLHGGSGSWLHWLRNIEPLREHFDVYAADLPGLGDAAMCKVESSAESAASATHGMLTDLFQVPFHIVAFSWGCTLTALLMAQLESRLKSVMLTGPAAVGDLPKQPQMKPLIKRTPGMSRQEVLETQRENLARLMIYRRGRIDDMAVLMQDINTSKARFSSPQYARSTLLIDGLRGTRTPLFVIYGEFDAPAYPELEARRRIFRTVRPDVSIELVPDAGHWLQYEKPDLFNRECINWIRRHSG